MAKVSIAMLEKAAQVPSPEGTGDVESYALFDGPNQPIHLIVHRLRPGSSFKLVGENSDLALFVWKGSIEVGGATLTAKSSAIVEHGASLRVRAGEAGTDLLAFGVSKMDEQAPRGRHVHILPSERVPRTESLGGSDGVGGALHADARCPTCNVWLHENSYVMADKETAVHSHSEDEVIFVHSGSVRLGNRVYGPGTALAVAANTKYGFFRAGRSWVRQFPGLFSDLHIR